MLVCTRTIARATPAAYGRGDGRVLVDIADRDALWEVLDADGHK